MILYFGKHKGEDITDVPSDYLHWLSTNHEDAEIAEAAEEEYQRREAEFEHIWERE
jgi:hypothetical protein